MSDNDFLEKQNKINLIGYYTRKLRLVLEGASVDEVFDKVERRKLRRSGILAYISNDHDWFITETTKEILNT